MFHEHAFLKQTIPPLLLLLYLVNVKTKKTEPIFHALIIAIYLFIPLYLTAYLSGFNILTLINNSWRTWATPTQYAIFMIAAYELTFRKTRDVSYSMVLSVHMASATGYLYEIPRYFYLQGLRGLIRFNKYSVFKVSYSIISLAIIVVLLSERTARLNKQTLLSLFVYGVFTVWYYSNFQQALSLKYVYAWVCGVRVPWVCIFRTPTMLFLLSLTQTLNTNTPTHTQ